MHELKSPDTPRTYGRVPEDVGRQEFSYHRARARSYYAVPSFLYSEVDARPRTTPFRRSRVQTYIGVAVWEDTIITANMKAR